MCVIMIQPVNALAPKVFFKGRNDYVNSAVSESKRTEKNLAIANAGGISTVAGALTAVIARSYTATWKNAALFGLGGGLITMMFICPKLLYKAGFNTTQSEKGVDSSKKLLDINTNKISNYSKSTIKKLR